MEKNIDEKIGDLVWSVRERLLQEIIPSLRAVAVDWQNNCIILYFYHDGKVNDAVEDHYSCIGTEVIADFSHETIDEQIISLKYPEPLPDHAHWAYRRKEPFVDPK